MGIRNRAGKSVSRDAMTTESLTERKGQTRPSMAKRTQRDMKTFQGARNSESMKDKGTCGLWV